jgi:hypothetical protein
MRSFPAQMPRFILVACLALSVIGTFTFVAVAELPAFVFWENESKTGGFITSVDADYVIDCLNEYTGRTRGYPFFSSRKSMRIITPAGTLYAGSIALFPVMKIAKSTKTPNNKNTLLLKLRI